MPSSSADFLSLDLIYPHYLPGERWVELTTKTTTQGDVSTVGVGGWSGMRREKTRKHPPQSDLTN